MVGRLARARSTVRLQQPQDSYIIRTASSPRLFSSYHHLHRTSMDTVRIYIVRHGETEENKQKIIQGHLDTALNLEGERQADLVAKALKDIPFDACYASDLRRAVDTAKRILVYHPDVEVQTQTAVRERVRRLWLHHSIFCCSLRLKDGPNSIWGIYKVASLGTSRTL